MDLEKWFVEGALFDLGQAGLLLASGNRQWHKEAPKGAEYAFYAPDFFLTLERPWFTHEAHVVVSPEELIKELCNKTSHCKKADWQREPKGEFKAAFDGLQKIIIEKNLIKAVPFASWKSNERMTGDYFIQCLVNLLTFRQGERANIYGFWGEKQQLPAGAPEIGVLGATPEILFNLDGNKQLSTMACAGTLLRNEKVDDKLVKEHQVVIDGIVNSLQGLSLKEINIEPTGLKEFGRLTHLVTNIRVRNCDICVEELIAALHPTPALGAYPREEGWKWLKQQLPRGRFGAPFGCYEAKSGSMRCDVAIRNIAWTDTEMTIRAGCGVVAESLFENEWEEINRKFHAIREITL